MKKILYINFLITFSSMAFAGDGYVSGKVTALMGSAGQPAIMIGNKLVPNLCDGGPYSWLYFEGAPEQQQWIYSTALAMALSGKTVTVYTNSNGERCRINNIQVTSGLI